MEIESAAFKLYEKSIFYCKIKKFNKALDLIQQILEIDPKFKEAIIAK